MFSSLTTFHLLAETRMAEVSMQYREDVASSDPSVFWYLLIPIFAVSVGFAIYRIVDREPRVVNTPLGMLHEICRVHRINKSGRYLLDQIAEEAGLEQPASMLLGVTQFEHAVEKAGQHMKYDRRQQTTLGMLRRRLFS